MTRATLCWLAKTLGRRRAVAVMFGLIHVGQGLIVLRDPGLFPPDDAVFFATFPIPLRVGLWIGTGALTILFALHPHTERAAWVTVMIMPAERLVGHTVSLIAWLWPGGRGGSEWAAAYMLFWGGLVAVLLMAAGWREDVPERLKATHEDR